MTDIRKDKNCDAHSNARGVADSRVCSLWASRPRHAQTKLTFLLNVPPAGYNAGFELAVEKGFYKEAGLDVTIEPGNGSQTTAQLISVGKYDIGFAEFGAGDEAHLARREGEDPGDDPAGQSRMRSRR